MRTCSLTRELRAGNTKQGLLFDHKSWTRGYERTLMMLWDAASSAAPQPHATSRGVGAAAAAAGMHVIAAAAA